MNRLLKREDHPGAQSSIVLDTSVCVGQLRPQPVGLERAERKMILEVQVQAAANLQRETVRAAGSRTRARKQAVKAKGFSNQGMPEN